MAISNQLQALGVVTKEIDRETEPSKPIWWSRHTWRFGDEKPGIIRIRMAKLLQNGREILYSALPLGQIDAFAGVPSFHPGITNVEAANLALNPTNILTYQRALIKERIGGIQSAWRGQNFSHTGTISLHVPPEHLESGAIMSEEDEDGTITLVINLEEILIQRGDEFHDVDTTSGVDHRPFHVIDGQHRKVSCEDDIYLQDFPVFINVLPLGSSYAEAAQLFTELNVTSEPLRQLHQLHQRFTCKIPHREANKDFGDPEEEGLSPTRRPYRIANRRAFTLAMELAATPNSPLYERIQTMELPNRQLGRGCAITSKKFVEFARSWFIDTRLLANLPDHEAYSCLNSYLRAFRSIANSTAEAEFTDEEGWSLTHTRADQDPYITRPLPFEAVLGLFPQAYDYAKSAFIQDGSSLTERFKEVLKPLLAIDFTDYGRLYSHYQLNQETPKALHAWFSWAIAHYRQTGILHPKNEVWNPDTMSSQGCKPGAGFFSPPNPETIEGMVEWLEGGVVPGNEITVWLRPYPNTHRSPFMSVKYLDKENNVIHSQSSTAVSGDQQHSFLRHMITDVVLEASSIQVQIILTNLHGEAQVQRTFALSEFEACENRRLSVGAELSIPAEWHYSMDDGDADEEENDEDTQTSYTTAIKAGDRYMTPPPKANRVECVNYGHPVIPTFSRMLQCAVCQSGMDCNNRQCIGQSTINGYVMS